MDSTDLFSCCIKISLHLPKWLTICNIEATTVSLLSEVDFTGDITGKMVIAYA